jgi:hypothetical protein
MRKQTAEEGEGEGMQTGCCVDVLKIYVEV